MNRAMPKDLQALMEQLHDPETIRNVQGRWNEYVAENYRYELAYPQQFGHQVEGNLKFKEQKAIQTPAEQMAMFENMTKEYMLEQLDRKKLEQKEQLYELDQDEQKGANDNQPKPERQERIKDFQLSFDDMGLRDRETKVSVQERDQPKDLQRSQELNVVWLQEYKDSKVQEAKIPEQMKNEPQQSYDLKLTFGKLEDFDKADQEVEPEQPGYEPGDD